MNDSPLDILAVGAHPDDIEIACGGARGIATDAMPGEP
jgi:LmbE family N-acetylglucosaminyl deacetylase